MAVILVTDAEQRAALAVVRSLGRAGHEVHVTGVKQRPLAAASRWCSSLSIVPDPMRDAGGNAAAHAEICARLHADVCIPIAESTALALLDAPPAGTMLPMPDRETFRAVCDKARVLAAATSVSLRVPRQVVIDSKADFSRERSAGSVDSLPLPLIAKPSRSIAGPGGQLIKLPVRYADTVDELARIVSSTPDEAFPLLLQERISGDGLGVFLLLWNGQIVATFGHRRLREKPPTGGVSTLRESVPVDPRLHARSLALLKALGMTHGVAMVEFKGEPGTDPALMEINGRFWGSLQLAIDAGVDFPSMLVSLALGRSVDPVTTYRTGVSSRWFWGDIDHIIARVRRRVDVRGAPTTESPVTAMREVLLQHAAGQREEIWRADDKRPFIRESLQWMLRR